MPQYFIPHKEKDDHIGRKKLLCFFAENFKKKRVTIKEEGNFLLLLFEEQETDTTRRYPINNTLNKG